jgi:uncharacterized 2Fe-2S/4Fe-4S cluster protein (DUF4445 family)
MSKKEKSDKKTALVDFEPVGRRAEIEVGETLLTAAQSSGVELVSVCGGIGSCASCSIRLVGGELSQPTEGEEEALGVEALAKGFRLACQAKPLGDVKVEIPPESLATPQRLQVEGQYVDVGVDQIVTSHDIQLEAPTLIDLRSDSTRLLETLEEKIGDRFCLDHSVLSDISDRLRDQDWAAHLAVRDGNIVAIFAPGTKLLGLAIDIGTTKLAGYLLDLVTGETLGMMGAMNPQISYGEDVISRIAYTNEHPEGRATLKTRLVDTLNGIVSDLCSEVNLSADHIIEVVMVGNTAMHHLAVGLPVQQLAVAPYVSATNESLEFPAREIGLQVASGASIYLPPNIAGFVGADHVAMILATDVWQTDRTVLALDIGTNTEITLAIGGRLLSCSCASGPAFEGAHIKDGMRAASGAIERVQIIGGEVRTFTIGAQPPIGICGSGILDAVSELLNVGLIDHRGAFSDDDPRVHSNGQERAFILVLGDQTGHGRDIVITRKDINEIQLAKAAIRTGIDILLNECGVKHTEVEEFIIAGAFGTYLDVESAIRIGMFPDLPRGRFHQVGNAAGTGARQMLISAERRRIAAGIVERMEYIELTTYAGFQDKFMKVLHF